MARPRLHVCFVAPKAYPLFNPEVESVIGGAEVDLYYLSTELARDNDFAVSFLVADYGQPPREKREGVELVKGIDFRQSSLRSAWRIWRTLGRIDAQVYLLATASPGTAITQAFCRRRKRAFVFRTESSMDCDGTYLREHPILGRLYARSLRRAQAIVAQNQRDAESLLATIGAASTVVPNGHRLPELTARPRETILWVGRSAAVKRADLFIRLAQEMPGRHFTLICQRATGDEHYDELVAQAKTLANLTFIPRVAFHEIGRYFAAAQVFVNTSDAEGFPNTFVQACCSGTPMLSLNVNPDGFLDTYHCGRCAGGDWERFKHQLEELLGPAGPECGAHARRYVEEHHDVTKIIGTYKSLFRRLAGDADHG